VRDYLTSLGVQGSRLRTKSYGEERPVDPGHTEEAWARNRRGEFVVE
jgi:peptidoglycan-associated lipoprotein